MDSADKLLLKNGFDLYGNKPKKPKFEPKSIFKAKKKAAAKKQADWISRGVNSAEGGVLRAIKKQDRDAKK